MSITPFLELIKQGRLLLAIEANALHETLYKLCYLAEVERCSVRWATTECRENIDAVGKIGL